MCVGKAVFILSQNVFERFLCKRLCLFSTRKWGSKNLFQKKFRSCKENLLFLLRNSYCSISELKPYLNFLFIEGKALKGLFVWRKFSLL